MTTRTTMSRPIIAAFLALAALGFASSANAGIHQTGNGGAVCKGVGSCLVLELDCKGTYTDATQKDGTVYGECSRTSQINPGNKKKIKAFAPRRR